MLTLKRLPVYTRVNSIPLYAHSNIGLFSTRESHPFAHGQQTLGRDRTNQIARLSPGGAFGWLICRQESCVVPLRSPLQAREWRSHKGKNEMEWEEALLTAWGEEISPHAAAYYRRQAARAQRVAEGAATKAEKARLLDDADHNDELAAKADRAETEAEKS
jgi:hypothetical protein